MYSPIEGKFNTLLRERIEHWRNANELYEDSTHRRHPSKKDFDLWLSVKFRINVSLSSNDFFVGNLRIRTSREASMIRKQIELVRTLVYGCGIEISFPRPPQWHHRQPVKDHKDCKFSRIPYPISGGDFTWSSSKPSSIRISVRFCFKETSVWKILALFTHPNAFLVLSALQEIDHDERKANSSQTHSTDQGFAPSTLQTTLNTRSLQPTFILFSE